MDGAEITAPAASDSDDRAFPRIGELPLSPDSPRVAASFCQPHTPADFARWRQQGLQIAEWRLDLAPPQTLHASANIARLLAASGDLPSIVTLRPRFEGGQFAGDEATRQKIFATLPRGDAIDIELAASILPAARDAARAQGRTLIVSRHNFSGADSAAQLDDGMASALAAGAEVFKCACLCTCAAALQTLADFAQRCRAARRACIVIGMDDGSDNPHAKQSRLQLPAAGSCIAFAAAAQTSAPGQLSLADTAAACGAC